MPTLVSIHLCVYCCNPSASRHASSVSLQSIWAAVAAMLTLPVGCQLDGTAEKSRIAATVTPLTASPSSPNQRAASNRNMIFAPAMPVTVELTASQVGWPPRSL